LSKGQSINACIKDIEYYLPEYVLSNDELEKIYDNWSAEKIHLKTGIKNRHIADSNETALDLAEKVALKLFQKNKDLSDKIDFIVLCTQSPDYFLPTSACILQERLKLSTNCGAFDFNLGCSGFVYGLAIAKGLILSGCSSNTLLIMADTYSKFIHPFDKSTRTIFGDGAAAVWVGRSEGTESLLEFVFGTDGAGANNFIVPAGGMRCPHTENTSLEITDLQGNKRSKNNMYMNGTEIANFMMKTVPELVEDSLNKNNLKKEEIDYFIFHQANKYILEKLREKIKIPEDKFHINMENIGNTVSSTIPIALASALEKNTIIKNYTVMLVGFGVGYSWASCVIKW